MDIFYTKFTELRETSLRDDRYAFICGLEKVSHQKSYPLTFNPHTPDRFTAAHAGCGEKLRISADSSLIRKKKSFFI